MARELSVLTERAIFLHDSGRLAQESLHTECSAAVHISEASPREQGFWSPTVQDQQVWEECCREGGELTTEGNNRDTNKRSED